MVGGVLGFLGTRESMNGVLSLLRGMSVTQTNAQCRLTYRGISLGKAGARVRLWEVRPEDTGGQGSSPSRREGQPAQPPPIRRKITSHVQERYHWLTHLPQRLLLRKN